MSQSLKTCPLSSVLTAKRSVDLSVSGAVAPSVAASEAAPLSPTWQEVRFEWAKWGRESITSD